MTLVYKPDGMLHNSDKSVTQKEEFKSVIQNNNNDINALFKTLEDFINK